MTHDDLVAHCLTKPGAYLDHPWSEEHIVASLPKSKRPTLGQ